ncbi:MAG: transcriptional repressor [Pseudomonadota bacterium]
MDSVSQIVDHAEQHCASRGTRLTNKRKHVLRSLLRSGKALSAYELIDECKIRFENTLPATSMYRILDFLSKERLVHRLSMANKYVACSHITCDHECEASQFLICIHCQKVKEVRISQSTVTDLQATIGHAGFHLATTQFEINCICDGCALTTT